MSGDGSPEIEVRVGGDAPGCPRCGRPALMAALVPHGWDNPGGPPTRGRLPVVLCADCGADDPHAGPLITFFHVHGQVTAATLVQAAGLIRRWAQNAAVPAADPAAVDREHEAWRRGEL